jgi:hypothetical protein
VVAAQAVRVGEDLGDGEIVSGCGVNGDGGGAGGGDDGVGGRCEGEDVGWVCGFDAVEGEVLLGLRCRMLVVGEKMVDGRY